MNTITKHHATPQSEFDAYRDLPKGTVVATGPMPHADQTGPFVAIAHGTNWLASQPFSAKPVLMFSAFRSDYWLGDFCTLQGAKDAAGIATPAYASYEASSLGLTGWPATLTLEGVDYRRYEIEKDAEGDVTSVDYRSASGSIAKIWND